MSVITAFQQAALLAVSGGDRYDRTFPAADAPPAAPLCVRCNAGSHHNEDKLHSPRCEQDGHQPFGASDENWEHAQERYTWQRRLWNSQHGNPDHTPNKT